MSNYIASIHQPNLFPRLKVLQKIYHSDVYICYDDVQFVRNDWQNRVYIRGLKNLKPFWLLIPVNKPNGQKSKINEVKIADNDKIAVLIERQLSCSYSTSNYWDEIQNYLHPVISGIKDFTLLSDFLYFSLKNLLDLLCPNVNIIRSSEIDFPFSLEKNLHLIQICNYAHANEYICGSGGLTYIDQTVFNANGIRIIMQDWDENSVRRQYSDIPWRNLSFIDFWARYGLVELQKVLGGDI